MHEGQQKLEKKELVEHVKNNDGVSESSFQVAQTNHPDLCNQKVHDPTKTPIFSTPINIKSCTTQREGKNKFWLNTLTEMKRMKKKDPSSSLETNNDGHETRKEKFVEFF